MSTSASAILNQAIQLPDAECEEIYLRLADHLYGPHDEPSDASKAQWSRRWEEITSGKVPSRDALEVLQEVRKRHDV